MYISYQSLPLSFPLNKVLGVGGRKKEKIIMSQKTGLITERPTNILNFDWHHVVSFVVFEGAEQGKHYIESNLIDFPFLSLNFSLFLD